MRSEVGQADERNEVMAKWASSGYGGSNPHRDIFGRYRGLSYYRKFDVSDVVFVVVLVVAVLWMVIR